MLVGKHDWLRDCSTILDDIGEEWIKDATDYYHSERELDFIAEIHFEHIINRCQSSIHQLILQLIDIDIELIVK